MATRYRALRVLKLGLGLAALARPRRAALAAALLLALAALVWLLVAQPGKLTTQQAKEGEDGNL